MKLVDGGKSAKDLSRPNFKILMKEIMKDSVDKVLIYNLSRLSRDVSDSNIFIKLCIKHGVELLCVKDAERVQIAMESMTGHKKWVYGKTI